MTGRRLPRYQGTDPRTVAELHDAAMDRLVAQYRAATGSAAPELNAERLGEPAEADGTTTTTEGNTG
jgi:hypothetical protein